MLKYLQLFSACSVYNINPNHCKLQQAYLKITPSHQNKDLGKSRICSQKCFEIGEYISLESSE